MKRRLLLILIFFMLVSGTGILLYPSASNWFLINFRRLDIVYYDEAVEGMDPEYVAAEMEKARKYNDALTGKNIEDPFIPGSGIVLPEGYTAVLNIEGIIGYIIIPVIDVYLPIYHGTDNEVLEIGVGHLEKTAFPIGGEGNHAVLTGHSGLTSAKLFTDLAEVIEGDVFYITVLDQRLAYEVDQILVVEPHDTDKLRPVKDEDYVTLVTCTPYGINSHRLFVRGTRVPYVYEEEADKERAEGTAFWYNLQVVIILCIVAVISILAVIWRCRRRRRRHYE